jgi:hypothetical protein
MSRCGILTQNFGLLCCRWALFVVTFGKILGHFSPIVPPSAAGFASVTSDAGGPLWRKLERSKIPGSPPSWGFDVPLSTALCKTFLLKMLNGSWAGRNQTKGCSEEMGIVCGFSVKWRLKFLLLYEEVLYLFICYTQYIWQFMAVDFIVVLLVNIELKMADMESRVGVKCHVRVQLKCDGTWWCTGGEVKGKLVNGVGGQYSSHYFGTWCIQHYYCWCAQLGCQ